MPNVTQIDAAKELLARRRGRTTMLGYIIYCNPEYKRSQFSDSVCAAIDKFIEDVQVGKRPVLILSAPPQHGKSEIVSRQLPAYLMARFKRWRIAAASYSNTLAGDMSQDVRRNIASDRHLTLFPTPTMKRKYSVNRNGQFSNPYGRGSYISDGIGGGFTGKPADIFIIDDPIKNAQEALSITTKESVWNWYLSTSKTRMSENSGLIVMMTRWADDDLAARVVASVADKTRVTDLRFPAINIPTEVGYNPQLPEGPLAPELHSIGHLMEFKSEMSDYWWAALYQQSPKPLGGNIFKDEFIQYWLPKDLPEKFDKFIISVDATFKEKVDSDFVSMQVWGRKGAYSYLLDRVHARLSFTKTSAELVKLRNKWPSVRQTLIEDKANGPAIIDFLKADIPGLIPVEPDGDKVARAHAVTHVWEARNVYLPHFTTHPWIVEYLAELTRFPAGANDDDVDAATQALRFLYPPFGKLSISAEALNRAKGIAS